MISSGGLGPWFCSLLFNTSEKCKKQTHIIPHTYTHLAVDSLNRATAADTGKKRQRKEENEDCWVLIFKVGPFTSWNDCVAFATLWATKTRGKAPRLSKGYELYEFYRQKYGLKLWSQCCDKGEVLKEFYHPVDPIGPPAFDFSSTINIAQAMLMVDDEETLPASSSPPPTTQTSDDTIQMLKTLFCDGDDNVLYVSNFKTAQELMCPAGSAMVLNNKKLKP